MSWDVHLCGGIARVSFRTEFVILFRHLRLLRFLLDRTYMAPFYPSDVFVVYNRSDSTDPRPQENQPTVTRSLIILFVILTIVFLLPIFFF